MIEQDSDKKTLEKIISSLGELPSAPLILEQALRLTSDLKSNIDDISKAILADQVLTAKVIRLSNSPIFGRSRKIDSLHEAISVLGYDQIKSLIITATTFQIFGSTNQREIAHILWLHSLATALGSRIVAKSKSTLDKEEAYLCGLLHDIGKLAILLISPTITAKVIKISKENGISIFQVENEELGFNHIDVGKALLKKWKFPDHLIDEISGHHDAMIYKPEETKSITRVVTIANSISKYIGASFFEPYKHNISGNTYIGTDTIADDELVELRVQVEETYYNEINHFYNIS